MLDREVRLPGPQPEPPAPKPTTSRARIELQAAVQCSDGDVDFFAEVAEHESSAAEDGRIFGRRFNGPPGEFHALPATYLQVFGPAVYMSIIVAECRVDQSSAVARVARYRLFQKLERSEGRVP